MTETILLETSRRITPKPRVHYIHHPFVVPEGVGWVRATLKFTKTAGTQIFVSLHDPINFRGNRMKPGAEGDIELELWVSPDDASEGAIPGEISAGNWRVQVDLQYIGEPLTYQITVVAEHDERGQPLTLTWPDDHVLKAEAGWYKGELHAHSTESDGKYPVEKVARAAVDIGLDFFALTDHFTTSQWRKLIQFMEQPVAWLRSMEITSHIGHANMHGMKEWISPFVEEDGWSMNQAADAVHAQGGLFCVNHAYSGYLGWRDFTFDWNQADLYEIYHNLEGCNNAYQVGLWDQLLNQGQRIVGVGGIDSHDPFDGLHELGQLVTWVYADNLSEKSIVEGLKRGQVYVSKGPQLRFTAHSEIETAQMWEALSAVGEQIELSISVLTDEQVRLFVFRDGQFFSDQVIEMGTSWQQITITDLPKRSTYYRVELHSTQKNEDYPYIPWRDHSTMRAMSNPIFVN